MNKLLSKGLFIVFEGIEGSGKTTQINYLYEYLKSKKLNVTRTREPGGTLNAERIRSIVLDKNLPKLDGISEAFLIVAARREHFKKVIEPALKKKHIVICDRFIDSTIAYQGNGLGVSIKIINNLNNIAIGNVKPDITVLLDLDPQIGLNRVSKRSELDKFEQYSIQFHKKTRNAFLNLAMKNPERYIVIDADKEEKELKDSIIKIINDRLCN